MEVLRYVATLVVSQVEGAGCLRKNKITLLLHGLPNLKEFCMLGAVRIDAGWMDDKWELSELVSVDWACTGLEVFGCTIGGIPRPHIARRLGGASTTILIKTEAEPESIAIQRGVYAQLGRLKMLTELTLKTLRPCYKVRDVRRHLDHHFYDCLAMSLESGLDLLANLGDLRRVDLEDMSVKIGNPAEQAWVAEHWPLATVVYARYPETGSGTNVNSYIDGEPDDDESDVDEFDDSESDEYPDGYLYRRRLEDFDDELGNGIVDYS